MNARVESMGGTTLEMIIPSTLAMSSPTGENRLRSRMPHSSAVCSGTVRSRHCETSSRPSNAPIVILLLPASRASSTYASCKDQSIGSVVAPHDQIAVGIHAGGSAGDLAIHLSHHHAPPGHVAGRLGEDRQNRVLIFPDQRIDRRQQRHKDFFSRYAQPFVHPPRPS